MVSTRIITDVVCPFCGTLCDDIEVIVEDNRVKKVRYACAIGTTKFKSVNEPTRLLKPLFRNNGRLKQVSLESAVDKAAETLLESERPLLYGWSSTGCEAHQIGVALAEEVGGVIDNTTSVCHGPSVLAMQDVGSPTLTLGEVKNRADLVIYWGSNPVHSHPRHLSRYSMFPRGRFKEGGKKDRKLVVIDVRKTDTAKIADKFLQIKPGCDYELISALRSVINGGKINFDEVAGIPEEEIRTLAEECMNCQFGVLFFGVGLTMSPGKHRNIDNLISLAIDLNRHTKFSMMAMRGHYNVLGFAEVLSWQVGYPFAVDFARGYPWYNPGETSANDLLQREEVDSCLIVASDPVANFPKPSVEYLAKIPLTVIDPYSTLTTEIADLVIPCSVTGVETEATAYRMDTVPLRTRKVLNPPPGISSDVEILKMILQKVREKKENGTIA
jgi:formylmethanofuran dehydrogenase subunit B